VPAGFESFERLIEVVGRTRTTGPARGERWKHYADRGYAHW
jgi:DNA polymerase-3 subunit chi